MTRLRPRFLSVVSVVALALLAGACGGNSALAPRAWAARVGGTEISRSDFTDQLDAIRGNDELSAFFAQATGLPVDGEGDSAGAAFSAVWLTQIIQGEIVRQAAEDSGVEITDSVKAVAAELAPSQFLTPNQEEQLLPPDQQREALAARFEALPAAFRDAAVDQLAALVAFAMPEGDVELACARHILVSTQPDSLTGVAPDPAAALAEAQDLRARLEAGEDFAQLAATESDDAGSAAAGGDLGCLPRGATVAEFDAALFELQPGEISEPVATDFGYHIIEVTDRITGSFDELTLDQQAIVITAALQSVDAAELRKLIEDADVEVDPSFGEWLVDDQGARVEPPAGADAEQRPADTGATDTGSTDTGPTGTSQPGATSQPTG